MGIIDAALQAPGFMEAEQAMPVGSDIVMDVKSTGSREWVGESCSEWRGRDLSKDLSFGTSQGDSEGKTSRRREQQVEAGRVGCGLWKTR